MLKRQLESVMSKSKKRRITSPSAYLCTSVAADLNILYC